MPDTTIQVMKDTCADCVMKTANPEALFRYRNADV